MLESHEIVLELQMHHRFLNSSQKLNQITSFSAYLIPLGFLTEDIADVRKLFESLPNTQSQFSTGLTRITIGIPSGQNRSDVGSFVADLLHANGIEWEDAYFSRDKMIITLNTKDAARAYDILRSEISR